MLQLTRPNLGLANVGGRYGLDRGLCWNGHTLRAADCLGVRERNLPSWNAGQAGPVCGAKRDTLSWLDSFDINKHDRCIHRWRAKFIKDFGCPICALPADCSVPAIVRRNNSQAQRGFITDNGNEKFNQATSDRSTEESDTENDQPEKLPEHAPTSSNECAAPLI